MPCCPTLRLLSIECWVCRYIVDPQSEGVLLPTRGTEANMHQRKHKISSHVQAFLKQFAQWRSEKQFESVGPWRLLKNSNSKLEVQCNQSDMTGHSMFQPMYILAPDSPVASVSCALPSPTALVMGAAAAKPASAAELRAKAKSAAAAAAAEAEAEAKAAAGKRKKKKNKKTQKKEKKNKKQDEDSSCNDDSGNSSDGSGDSPPSSSDNNGHRRRKRQRRKQMPSANPTDAVRKSHKRRNAPTTGGVLDWYIESRTDQAIFEERARANQRMYEMVE